MNRKRNEFCPEWSWWVRSGERHSLGLDVRVILREAGMTGKYTRQGLAQTVEHIEEGLGIPESLRRAGLSLPIEAWSLLEAGEVTGRLGEAMIQTGLFLRDREKGRREFLGQLWYPGLVILTGIGVMALILFWVVPQMREISRSMGRGEDLPWITEHIGLIYATGLGCLVFLVAGSAGASLFSRWIGARSLRWSSVVESIFHWVPLWGWMRRHRREARISRQVGTLLGGGITLPSALEMAAAAAPDLWEKHQLLEFRTRLIMGAGFREGLEAFPLVQPGSRALLLTGQECGRLDHYLLQVAGDLNGQASRRLSLWVRFLEPAMLLVLSLAIGGLILAYLLPMVAMLEQLA